MNSKERLYEELTRAVENDELSEHEAWLEYFLYGDEEE